MKKVSLKDCNKNCCLFSDYLMKYRNPASCSCCCQDSVRKACKEWKMYIQSEEGIESEGGIEGGETSL